MKSRNPDSIERFNKLMNQSVTAELKTIDGEVVEVPVYALPSSDLSLFVMDEDAPMEEQVEKTRQLFEKTLERSGFSEEQINNFPMLRYMDDLSEAIFEVNDIDEEDRKDVKDRMEKMRENVKNEEDAS